MLPQYMQKWNIAEKTLKISFFSWFLPRHAERWADEEEFKKHCHAISCLNVKNWTQLHSVFFWFFGDMPVYIKHYGMEISKQVFCSTFKIEEALLNLLKIFFGAIFGTCTCTENAQCL